MLVQTAATQLPNQLPASALGKTANDGPRTRAPASQVELLAAGFILAQPGVFGPFVSADEREPQSLGFKLQRSLDQSFNSITATAGTEYFLH